MYNQIGGYVYSKWCLKQSPTNRAVAPSQGAAQHAQGPRFHSQNHINTRKGSPDGAQKFKVILLSGDIVSVAQ